MPLTEAELLMSAFVAFGTFALAIATFMTILRDEKEKQLTFIDRKLEEIRTILVQEISYYYRIINHEKASRSLKEEQATILSKVKPNADDLARLSALQHEFDSLGDELKALKDALNEMHKYSPSLFALLNRTKIDNAEFNRLKKQVLEDIARYTHGVTGALNDDIALTKKMMDSMESLRDCCITLSR